MGNTWLDAKFWQTLPQLDGWTIFTGVLLTFVLVTLPISITAYLNYQYNRKHSLLQHNVGIEVERLKREFNALEQVWELLVYMSLGESEQAIVVYRENKKQNISKQYFVHFGNLRQFILQQTGDIFYQRHAGLYLPAHIRDQLFDYKGSLMGLYFRYKDEYDDAKIAENPLIVLSNQHLIDKLSSAYDQLNADLKKELEIRYQQLLQKS